MAIKVLPQYKKESKGGTETKWHQNNQSDQDDPYNENIKWVKKEYS